MKDTIKIVMDTIKILIFIFLSTNLCLCNEEFLSKLISTTTTCYKVNSSCDPYFQYCDKTCHTYTSYTGVYMVIATIILFLSIPILFCCLCCCATMDCCDKITGYDSDDETTPIVWVRVV